MSAVAVLITTPTAATHMMVTPAGSTGVKKRPTASHAMAPTAANNSSPLRMEARMVARL